MYRKCGWNDIEMGYQMLQVNNQSLPKRSCGHKPS